MQKSSKIYVAGHRGLVGSAVLKKLNTDNYENLICKTHKELDLISQEAVNAFFEREKPEYVFLAAAKVGGIMGNSTYPADFIYTNLAIQNNIIHAAYQHRVKRLLFLGSSCIYPRLAPQPMQEEYLMSGPLEPTNSPYAVAKIAGIEMCWAYNRQHNTQFIPVMPTNLYGVNDNFNLETSHVLPALIRKFHLAKLAQTGDWEGIQKDEARWGKIPADVLEALKEDAPKVRLWGSGSPRREFLHVDDLADACVFVMNLSENGFAPLNLRFHEILLNIGVGKDATIKELAQMVAKIAEFNGETIWDTEKPDGTPQKLLNVSRIKKLGWKAKIDLAQGITQSYEWYKKQSL